MSFSGLSAACSSNACPKRSGAVLGQQLSSVDNERRAWAELSAPRPQGARIFFIFVALLRTALPEAGRGSRKRIPGGRGLCQPKSPPLVPAWSLGERQVDNGPRQSRARARLVLSHLPSCPFATSAACRLPSAPLFSA
ncbi:hypothetical protein HPB48_005619 [Haemaphysalis longicornis]|uniref:Uncharacterized protein n=1 Tax=Haemaphysalis longicornis TaxID=44386 RepID=A0A9J6GGL3_HAELO|nr:hypothetical protein HPB48_005619 [Haemaphysalis longicornis]